MVWKMTDTRKRAEELAKRAMALGVQNMIGESLLPNATELIEQALITERNMALEDAARVTEDCQSLNWWDEVKEIRALKVKQND